MKSFVAGVVVTLVCILGGVYACFAGGLAPVATAARPMPFERKLAHMALRVNAPEAVELMPFERKLAHMALDAKLQKEMPRSVPIEANESN